MDLFIDLRSIRVEFEEEPNWDDFKYNGISSELGIEDHLEINLRQIRSKNSTYLDKSKRTSRLLKGLYLTEKSNRKECRFCKKNGEARQIYTSHNTKSNGKVVCPVLRAYVCPLCAATGDNAHTLKYCSLNKKAAMSAVYTSPRNSCGKFRFIRKSHGNV